MISLPILSDPPSYLACILFFFQQQPAYDIRISDWSSYRFSSHLSFSAQLSYNSRSDFVVVYNRVNDPSPGAGMLGPTLPVVEDGRGSLDFNAPLDPTKNVTIAFSATNLPGAAATNHRQYDADGNTYPWQTRFLETIYRVGARSRFGSAPARKSVAE